jgi:NTP pyrophosphatase (non-canonical NTP hydrolase)
MVLREWEKWLCEYQWRGYPLDRILRDSRLPQAGDSHTRDNAYHAMRSLFIIQSGQQGEGGESAEHFKKYIRDGGEMNKYAAALELGDELAYLTWRIRVLGYTLEEIAGLNYAKLTARGRRES